VNLQLQHSKIINQQPTIKITGSKSETNRLLLLQALYPNLVLDNTSNSDDSEVMLQVLKDFQHSASSIQLFDVHHAGTAMRFLTAFFAIQEGKEIVITGSDRMKERPIEILVTALNHLGADISYLENEGFPPIRIKGKKLTENKVALPAHVSSQYISALLLIASNLENGLELILDGEITSVPYIKMTLAFLNEIGIKTSFEKNLITVKSNKVLMDSKLITVESDWSSASYWYAILAISEIGTQISLSSFKKNSVQGDSILVEIYKDFGVETVFNEDKSITISKTKNSQLSLVNYQLNNCPDIAQTIAVTCFGLGIGCDLYGLHTLKIKETDRLEALKTELVKLGATVTVTHKSLHIKASNRIHKNRVIKTYQDHRMAMAFAPLALKVPIVIQDANVVTKSYPAFWEDLKRVGFVVSPT
jgi:3-phosphoshikimate 1-carboxyvinyltransferase